MSDELDEVRRLLDYVVSDFGRACNRAKATAEEYRSSKYREHLADYQDGLAAAYEDAAHFLRVTMKDYISKGDDSNISPDK